MRVGRRVRPATADLDLGGVRPQLGAFGPGVGEHVGQSP